MENVKENWQSFPTPFLLLLMTKWGAKQWKTSVSEKTNLSHQITLGQILSRSAGLSSCSLGKPASHKGLMLLPDPPLDFRRIHPFWPLGNCVMSLVWPEMKWCPCSAGSWEDTARVAQGTAESAGPGNGHLCCWNWHWMGGADKCIYSSKLSPDLTAWALSGAVQQVFHWFHFGWVFCC